MFIQTRLLLIEEVINNAVHSVILIRPNEIAFARSVLTPLLYLTVCPGKYPTARTSAEGACSHSLPRDNTQTEHGFVSLISLSDGRLGDVWLDGRNMKEMKETDEHAPAPASMTLRYAAIDAQENLSNEAELDNRVCECCQTSAAITSDGPIAVYRDRSATEVRDIYIVRQVKGTWSAPQAIHADNWQINGCPVNGPSVAADGRRVVVAWFTSVSETPHVKVVFSDDAGASFGKPIQVDDGANVGRVDTLLLPDGSALVCWLCGNVEGGAIKVRRVQTDGTVGSASVIAKTDISRSSGFPRMVRFGNEVQFAWTEFGKPSHVRTATADVSPYKGLAVNDRIVTEGSFMLRAEWLKTKQSAVRNHHVASTSAHTFDLWCRTE